MVFRIIYSVLFFLLLLPVPQPVSAQNIPFVPPSFNYGIKDYGAGNQNWAVAQGQNGVIYIGNNYGLLSFDAVNWNLHPLPNNLAVKSILVNHSSGAERIYVGSFEEFGYFERDETNKLCYHSLKGLVKDYTFRNDEIWTIHQLNDKLFFQSFSSYFVYNEKTQSIDSYKPYPAPLYFFNVEGTLYAQFIDENFYKYDGRDFKLLLTRERMNDDFIVSALPFQGKLLLVTSKSGIYSFDSRTSQLSRFPTAIDSKLNTAIVNRTALLPDSVLIIGTLNEGLFALNARGEELWHLNRSNGLNNNTCLGLFIDNENNLWTALDNGVSYIQTNSPLSFFEPKDIQIGLVEEILVQDNQLYIASNQGVYKYSESKGNFQSIPSLNVQSWFIRAFGEHIITGNNKGTSLIRNDRAIPIPKVSTGGMDIKGMTISGTEFLLESTYNDLLVYLKDAKGEWYFSHRVEGFSDLINQLEIDHTGNIWASHMYKGLYRLRLDNGLQRIVEQDFYLKLDSALESVNPVKISKLKGRIVFSDGFRFYTYDDLQRKIIPFEQLTEELPNLSDTRNIVPVNDSLFWFVRNKEYTVVKYNSENHYTVHEKIPFSILNNPPNYSRGNVYVDKNGDSYFCLNGGIGKYNFSRSTQQPIRHFEIASASSYNRKDGITQRLSLQGKNIIDYADNNITFELRYTDFSKNGFSVECFLGDYDNRWIPVASDLTISYTNLPANDYVLNARVVNESGEELATLTYPFVIKNPWYKTSWALFFYFLLGMIVLFSLVKVYIQMIVRRKNKLFMQQEKERLVQLERQEKLITQLKNEQLGNELVYKSKELANASMLIIKHEEFLNALKKSIQEALKSGKIQRSEGAELMKLIGSHTSGEDTWGQFQENFDLIHENFFRKLKERYPSLTSSDLRLCALLRLNYSSKDIANMLNLTLRGVEAARYRLRKKLALQEDQNLVEFMIDFH